ncbi:hypothetical protein GCM10009557_73370 [Virgisporangium ochraceum]|uniref:Uncharacterized protein n=1 Tax=Virgisporangium ochraceum TaxID=65505 RepID=A0A8J4A362_9ACTN|nr:hypothetical protein Voc01_082750 [Virgisporangium ochraceum]
MRHRRRRVRPDTSRGARPQNFGAYRDGVDAAVARGRRLDPTGTAYTTNPSTNVWQLVERIRAS